MHKMAIIRRMNKDGTVRDTAVNAAHVRQVISEDSGSYIAFEDDYGTNPGRVTPIGTRSPDPMEVVMRRLNKPYWIDVVFRVGGLVLSAAAIVIAILFSSH